MTGPHHGGSRPPGAGPRRRCSRDGSTPRCRSAAPGRGPCGVLPSCGPPAVVLVDRGRPHQPQVRARHERSVLVLEHELRLDRHTADPVQHPEQGLPRGLRASVRVGQRPAQPRCTKVERRVDEHDDVEQVEVTGSAEKCLGRRGQQQTLVRDDSERLRVPEHLQPGSARSRARVGHRREHGDVLRDRREPPAEDSGGPQVGERTTGREHETPRLEVLRRTVKVATRLVQPMAHRHPELAAKMPSSRSRHVVHVPEARASPIQEPEDHRHLWRGARARAVETETGHRLQRSRGDPCSS